MFHSVDNILFMQRKYEIVFYGLIGIINSILGFIIIYIFMYIGFSPEISNFIGYILGLLNSFFLNKKFTFNSNGSVIYEFIKFLVSFVVSYLMNFIVLWILIYKLILNPYFSQLLAGSVYVICFFILSKLFIFRIVK